MYKILVVEDDKVIADSIQTYLNSWGYDTVCVHNFQEVMQEFMSTSPQLVLMDISLPFYNGYHWCEEIRKLSQVPIIFISSASDNMNIVMAISRGGDDFIAKPFDLEILAAKIQALMRRTYSMGASAAIMEYAGVMLNLNDTTIHYLGNSLELTKNEFRILQVLFEHAGKVVSRETIMTRLWESDSYIDDNTLTVNMTRIRRKLEGIGLKDFILTKKGMGYRI